MGWLGWTWDEVRGQDVNVIEMALEGRAQMLDTCFGDGKRNERKKPGVTPARFRSFAERHNRRYARGEQARGREG